MHIRTYICLIKDLATNTVHVPIPDDAYRASGPSRSYIARNLRGGGGGGGKGGTTRSRKRGSNPQVSAPFGNINME